MYRPLVSLSILYITSCDSHVQWTVLSTITIIFRTLKTWLIEIYNVDLQVYTIVLNKINNKMYLTIQAPVWSAEHSIHEYNTLTFQKKVISNDFKWFSLQMVEPQIINWLIQRRIDSEQSNFVANTIFTLISLQWI